METFLSTKANWYQYHLGGEKKHTGLEAGRTVASDCDSPLGAPWPYAAAYIDPFTSPVREECIFPLSWILYSMN